MMNETRAKALPSPPKSKGGRPTLEYAEALSGKILAAALSVLIERGYDDLTMNLVAQRAGVSKKTLYSRFESKDELVAALVDDTIDKHIWSAGRVPSQGTVKQRLLTCLCAILNSTFKPEIMAIEEVFAFRQELQAQPRIRATRMVPVQMIIALLEEAKTAGDVDFENVTAVAFMFLDVVILGPRTRFLKLTDAERAQMPADGNASLVFETLWNGIAVQPDKTVRQRGRDGTTGKAARKKIPPKAEGQGDR